MKKFIISGEILNEVQKHLEDFEEHICNSSGCLRSIHAREVSKAIQRIKCVKTGRLRECQ
jgi:hypothetical protein